MPPNSCPFILFYLYYSPYHCGIFFFLHNSTSIMASLISVTSNIKLFCSINRAQLHSFSLIRNQNKDYESIYKTTALVTTTDALSKGEGKKVPFSLCKYLYRRFRYPLLEIANMEHPMGKLLIKLKDFKKKPPWHLYRTPQRLC